MLALIAGQGRLPGEIVAALDALPHVAALEGFPPDTLKPDEVFRFEHLGSVLCGWRDRGVREICLAGAVRRPPIDQTQIDAATMPLVSRIAAAKSSSDLIVTTLKSCGSQRWSMMRTSPVASSRPYCTHWA